MRYDPKPPKKRTAPLVAALLIILLLILSWYIVLPLFGVTLILTGNAMGFLISATTVLSVTVLLFLLFTGIGVLIFGIMAFMWAAVAISFFPVLFPVLVPLLVVLILIRLLRR